MKVKFTNLNGRQVCGEYRQADKNTTGTAVVMAHGFGRNKNMKTFLELEKLLLDEGISVLRIDLYGHGESEGKLTNLNLSEAVEDILAAVNWLKDHNFRKIGLIGSSFGGMASMLAAAKTKDIMFLGLRAPVSDFKDVVILRRFWKLLSRLKLQFFADLKNINFDEASRKISVPTLIVHGTGDRIVPIRQSRRTVNLIPKCELCEIEKAGHFFARKKYRRQLVNQLFEFVMRQEQIRMKI